MKILHLLASPFYTGPADTVVQLALAQRSLGHAVSIAVDRKRTVTTSEELIVPRLQSLGLLDEGDLELSVKSWPWRMAGDAWSLRRREVDVVHSHFSHDHTVARWGRPSGATLVRSLHAPRSVRSTLPQADALTVPYDALARQLIGHRVFVMPALVGSEFAPAPDRATLRASLGISPGPLIGMVSALQGSRRHELGLEAFARLRSGPSDVKLVVVGDGPLESQLREKAAPLGAAVRFVGYQSGPAFVSWLQALDEVWILGLGNDWGGRAAAQARACGVRVVAVDEGGLARYADAVISPEVDELVAAAHRPTRREVRLEAPLEAATRLTEFYGRSA